MPYKDKQKTYEAIKKYKKTPKGIEMVKRYRSRYRKNYPDKCNGAQYRTFWKGVLKELGFDKCFMCGRSETEIHCHHVNPVKKEFVIAHFVQGYAPTEKNKETFLNELKGCSPLCGRCHVKVHWMMKKGL